MNHSNSCSAMINYLISEPITKMNSMKLKAIILCMGVVGCLIFTCCGKSTSFSATSPSGIK